MKRSADFKRHGMIGTPEYNSWTGIKSRCNNPGDRAYNRYGGRGIKMHGEWQRSFTAFLNDVGRSPGSNFSLERINNDGNYEPGNVKWATAKQQQNNTRTNRYITMNGETMSMSLWCDKLGLNYFMIQKRIWAGWHEIDALTKPKGNKRTKNFTTKDEAL